MVKTEIKGQSGNNNTLKKKYKGVRMRSWGSWVSEIRAPNQKTRIWLGSYSTPEAAARAYDAALLCLKGSSANFNFPNFISVNPPQFPEIAAMSPKSIQSFAAAAAADHFAAHHSTSSSTSSPLLSNGSDSISPSLSTPNDPNIIGNYNNNYNNIEDDPLSLAGVPDYNNNNQTNQWYDFESPRYNEMVNGVFYDPSMNMDEDFYEDGDIRLWSFC